ncbi:MFS transporter [Streptomyces sp. LP05-1]|uniref:MFS transporter n=1 Tax=Streptomyces pyxinae TaxID=2970734 RepID=A0ABT2CJ49_9ACTN|nr:MFS transporter [Streptomyces sp. LP05-1]MCS0637451.1 MFS transporter [Streptomyces sp. LP05-1]
MATTPTERTTGTRVSPAPHPDQRRVLTVLVAAQALSGAGMAAGITVGALLAQQMLGTTALAGLPVALFTTGAALGAFAIGRLSQRRGRRPGLALGHATAAIGSLGVVAAATLGNAPLLLAALALYGAGSATNLLARYAGADLAPPERRGRAVSTVLVATTLGAVAGPNLTAVTGDLAHAWNLPRLAGPFLLAAVAYAAGALVIQTLLRPDPLLLARAGTAPPAGTPAPTGPAASASAPRLLTGATVMTVGQLVMVAVMTMTPVHMAGHGHGDHATGLAIAAHVAGMFLPSPLSGLLVDRVGERRTAMASGAVLATAAGLAALAPPENAALLITALALLGVGWNLSLVSGTSLVTDAVPLARRASVQGLADVGLALAGASGGMLSGLLVAATGYPALAAGGAALSLAVVPLLALIPPTHAHPADGIKPGIPPTHAHPADGIKPGIPPTHAHPADGIKKGCPPTHAHPADGTKTGEPTHSRTDE